jgi:hypothetical protein
VNEIEALRSQLRQYWRNPSTAQDVTGLTAKISIVMNPDRTPREVTVVDQDRYARDALFRLFADSVVEAVWRAGASKLRLPPEKFAAWSVINVTFGVSQ